ncbi:methionine ABC transporter ATP-binding protein [Paraburkholderia metrosideri]|jgi:D-methionine transport system ATP-binding protein|uniref:Methionine import ATP-binding protein MetN n=1 Tax=Paraburkholderia metrosideri TaxID=580937 RepID=A0ABM8NWQ7_9BURK|nr:ATP-binding cassette domain-containing protein [Paraburkholderia metrosideri]CAD6547107.1 Methionine import ATP-binding protein MetN [Paraburkholderia metrosideri]
MISIRQLTKTYGDGASRSTVLDSIDLSVERGEILAVVGPSGAGKSTLARCINLLERPSAGAVVVDGHELTGLSESALRVARRSIGTVFQASHMLSRRTAAGNVALPLEYLGVAPAERDARVAELLERVGLGTHAHRYPHQLSGGQRQRVGIARALALRPSVLLADEATSGLDPDNTDSIIDLLRELRSDLGLTVLMITHDMHVVRKIADRVARLAHGRIVELGSLLELLGDPASELGQSLLPRTDALHTHDLDLSLQVWKVSYQQRGAASDWIARLARETGGDVHLLAASVETISGVHVGHASIGLRADANRERIRALLADWGLHGHPLDPRPSVGSNVATAASAASPIRPSQTVADEGAYA